MNQNIYEKGISVVIPNYNGRLLLEENLPSLITALEKSGEEYEIIVSDDASTDDSIDFLKKRYPQISIITTEVNTGFSANCNRGIMNAKYALTCITNTDVTFDEDYFIKGIPYFTDPTLFAVKGDIFNYAGSKSNIISIDQTTQTYFKRGLIRFKTNITPDTTKFGSNIGDQYVGLGCCFIANTAHLQAIGGFSEIYSPYYWEDSDIAINALERGFSLKYTPECIVYHKASSTISTTQNNFKRKLISNRNKFIFTWLHLKGVNNWIKHITYIVINIFTRWLILDIKYYISLVYALLRYTSYPKTKSL